MRKNRTIVMYCDQDGKPRAWASGPTERLPAIREHAAKNLSTYLARHPETRRGDFTERCEPLGDAS